MVKLTNRGEKSFVVDSGLVSLNLETGESAEVSLPNTRALEIQRAIKDGILEISDTDRKAVYKSWGRVENTPVKDGSPCSECGKRQKILTRVGLTEHGEWVDLCDPCADKYKDSWEKKTPTGRGGIDGVPCSKCGTRTNVVDKYSGYCNKCSQESKSTP